MQSNQVSQIAPANRPIQRLALLRNKLQDVLTDKPVPAPQIYQMPEVYALAKDTNQVAVYLSDLCRRGDIGRDPFFLPGSNVKYGYRKLNAQELAKKQVRKEVKDEIKAKAHPAKKVRRVESKVRRAYKPRVQPVTQITPQQNENYLNYVIVGLAALMGGMFGSVIAMLLTHA